MSQLTRWQGPWGQGLGHQLKIPVEGERVVTEGSESEPLSLASITSRFGQRNRGRNPAALALPGDGAAVSESVLARRD